MRLSSHGSQRNSVRHNGGRSCLRALWFLAGVVALPVGLRGDEVERVSVLAHFEPGADRTPVRTFTAAHDGTVRYEYQILPNVVNLRDIPEAVVAEINAIPGVAHVETDARVSADIVDSTPLIRGLQEDIAAAGLAATGVGVRVCVCDTGIRTDHLMYADQIDHAAGYDFVNDGPIPEDDNGHGTHVAGIAVGRDGIEVDFLGGGGPEPFQGIACEATLIGVKVLGADGTGLLSDVIAGIEHCASSSLPGGRADVINLSLSDGSPSLGSCDSRSLAIAANNAVADGVVVVASAGNNAYNNALPGPACASQVIAVGATWDDYFPNPDFPPCYSFTFCTKYNIFGVCIEECTDEFPEVDQIACYSNRSNNLDVTAPGSYIWSADMAAPNLIIGKHGTSQAAPHVSGLAALMLEVAPTLSPSLVRQMIREGAIDLGPPGFDLVYGYGRVDVINSLALASSCETDEDCNDGLYCTGVETCVDERCVPGSDPCTPQLCRESDDTCVDCLSAADCEDDDPCNGVEICDPAGQCQSILSADCNSNGVEDNCDIAEGTSLDCNVNDIPDECDIAEGTSNDCNGNGVPDECDIAEGTSPDCNTNGVPDECDVAQGTSNDCNGNGIPDECETDCNGNGVPDDCDITGGTSLDCNVNDIPDECDIAEGTSNDCNGNGIPDECDIAEGTSSDCNTNDIPDECDITEGTSDDCNDNGVPDECDIAEGTSPDCNTNDVPDECDVAEGTSSDCNSNGIPDECDPDCNGNSVPDDCELPIVAAEGSRYLAVTPQPSCSATPVALFVTSPDELCIAKYVDVNGLLVDTPVVQTPGQWATAHVRGKEIIPDTTYTVQVQTTHASTGGISAITWLWGDVDDNRIINIDDMFLIIWGYQGDFTHASIENLDLAPCIPNRAIGVDDLLWCMRAYEGATYADTPCSMPCP